MYYRALSHVVPGDSWVAVGHLGGILQTWTFQGLPLLQRDDLLSDCLGTLERAVGTAARLVRLQHLQTHGDLTAGRLVAAGQRQETCL